MKQTTVIALFGPSGAGKNMILNYLNDNFGFHKIVNSTTRPKRDGESDGVDYNFLSLEEFSAAASRGEMLEYTAFREWLYGTNVNELEKNDINVGFFNIRGIQTLLQNTDIKIIPVFISVSDKNRLIRQLNRELEPDCEEICRRYKTDKEDFKNIPFDYETINNDNLFYYTQMAIDRLVKSL